MLSFVYYKEHVFNLIIHSLQGRKEDFWLTCATRKVTLSPARG